MSSMVGKTCARSRSFAVTWHHQLALADGNVTKTGQQGPQIVCHEFPDRANSDFNALRRTSRACHNRTGAPICTCALADIAILLEGWVIRWKGADLGECASLAAVDCA